MLYHCDNEAGRETVPGGIEDESLVESCGGCIFDRGDRIGLVARPPEIMAAPNFEADLAHQIGGSKVKMAGKPGNPDQAPALFELSPSIKCTTRIIGHRQAPRWALAPTDRLPSSRS